MESYEPKKLLILRILEILTEYSDAEHRLHQGDIISLLKVVYGIECERKAVARNIEYLQDAGYEIISDKSGVYLAEKKFEVGELRLLVDSVLASRNICKAHTKQLIEKLTKEGGKYFKNYARHVVNLDDYCKADGQEFFLFVELLTEAIAAKKKVRFCYQDYGLDKKLHPRREKPYLICPFQLFLKNGGYYLACAFEGHDDLAFVRVDRMAEVAVLEERARPVTAIKGCEGGLNLGKLQSRLPNLYYDDPQRVVFETRNRPQNILDYVFDTFGKDVEIMPLPSEEYRIALTTSPRAMRFWLLSYGRYVKVLSPPSLVDTIREDIEEMKRNYEGEKRGTVVDKTQSNAFVLLDIETSGLHEKRDRVISVSADKVLDGKVAERFFTYVSFEGKLSRAAMELTGIREEMLAGAPDLDTVMKNFAAFCGDLPIYADNVPFIKKFLRGYDLEIRERSMDGSERI